ncbi:hypothetical protein KKC13_03155 [bacterium]|nr:hypothetical protein [bacterium]MBU1958030.1 hypothetical protein [bacterium]
MIPIKIDDENIAFRDLHFNKVNESIHDSLTTKRDSFEMDSFEYQALDWISWHLNFILKQDVKKLRGIIQEFDNFIKTFIPAETLTIANNEVFSVDKLKQICRENNIRGFSNKNKNELVTLVRSHTSLSGEMVDNLKIVVLENKIDAVLKDVFVDFYENKWDDIVNYDRYIFVIKHNLKTCPYCNMGYILISERDKDSKNGLRPEIDHFFPKSDYPYLAMSFYNLIPSCKVCNHTKGSKDTYKDELLSPYEIDENTFKLTYRPTNMNFLQVKKRKYNTNNFEVEIKDKNNKQDDKDRKDSNDYFKLDKLYAQHKDVVLELLVKRTIYSKSYIAELKKNFRLTDDEIYRFLFCNYKDGEEFNKRPLSKLIKDITDELGFKRVGL